MARLLQSLVLTVAGVAVLALAADQFVVGAARLALAFRVSAVVVGAVVIGFGTSAPELLVAVLAAARGELGLAIGSVVGSNIANLTIVAGTAALVCPLAVASQTVRRELPLSSGAVLLLAAVLVTGGLGRVDGAVLAGALALAAWWIVRSVRGERAEAEEPLAAEAVEFAGAAGARRLRAEVARTLVGMLGTVAGANLLVVGARDLALGLGVSPAIVGITLVAVGTSLPELVTAIQAARRREVDLVIGNVLGSNIFNSLGVAGAAVLVAPATVTERSLLVWGPALMVGLTLAAAVAMWTGRRLSRWEGAGLLVLYVLALPLLVRA